MAIKTKAQTAQHLIDAETPVGEAIVQVLIEAGIDAVFGIPGGDTVASIYEALRNRQREIHTVLVRDESLAGVMAEVYGRLKGKPGVVVAQGAWILANTGKGILEAHLSSTPMVILADFTDDGELSTHAPYQCGTGDYGAWDFRQSLKGYTKQVFVPNSPSQAVQDVQYAIKHSLAGDRGPVAVVFGNGVVSGHVSPHSVPALYQTAWYLNSTRQPAAQMAVDRALEIIASAKSPVIVAGNGVRVSGAYAELQTLCEALPAPVVTTAAGKSAIPETHPYALGVIGNFGLPAANAAVASADVLIAVGTRLGATDTANEHRSLIDPSRQRLIQIDIESRNASWTFPVEAPLVGDAKVVLEQLLQGISKPGGRRPGRDLMAELDRVRALHGDFDSPESTRDDSPLLPQRIIRELNQAAAEDAIICCDAGENRIFMSHFYRTKSVGTYIQSAGVGAMGYAIPAALGAKIVYPDRQVIAVTGDGGFAMTMNGLMTALEEKLPITVVVFNNSALGWLKHEQADMGGEFKCDFLDFDHSAIARAMGCQGIRVEQPGQLSQALSFALACDQPTVIDVHTTLSESFKRVTSPLVQVHM